MNTLNLSGSLHSTVNMGGLIIDKLRLDTERDKGLNSWIKRSDLRLEWG